MNFPKYPEYKDSGIESVGKIPSHWTPRRIRSITSIQKGKLPKTTNPESNLESDLPYLTMEYLRGNEESISSMFIPVEDQTILANEGDILVLWDGSNAGEFLKAKKGVVSSTLAIIKNLSVEKNYLFYGLKSIERYLKDQTIGMGIPHVSNDTLRNLIIYLPSENEQNQIVKFLTHEITKIDALVTEQEKLIDLLIEKRQAVISQAVTKGLDPKFKMKDSEVEWLGDVPKHWDIKPIQWIASINDEVLPESTDVEYEIEYVDIGSVNLTSGIESSELLKLKDAPSRARRIVKDGDLIVSTVRTYLKAIAFIKEPPENMIVSTGFAVIRSISGFEASFAKFALQSTNFIDEVISRSKGVSYPAINASELAKIKIPLPPIGEQIEISSYLNNKTLEIDSVISGSNKIIVLLQERRSALISAAVTGQIDVRDYYGN